MIFLNSPLKCLRWELHEVLPMDKNGVNTKFWDGLEKIASTKVYTI